eukprot:jgi/Picre1/28488/NNA_003892.t1
MKAVEGTREKGGCDPLQRRKSKRTSQDTKRQHSQGIPALRPHTMTTGNIVFAVLIFLAAAYPFILPYVYLIFSCVALPIRVYDFAFTQSGKNVFFLLDFCYWVNTACIVFLILPPAYRDPHIEASLYALADGPVSFALLAWQCAWVMSSQEHTISVLIHLLPGLAMYAHHHLPRLSSWSQIAYCAPLLKSPATALQFTACVSLEAPEAAQVTMTQTLDIDNVVYRRYIKTNNLDTSFKCLARRAVRSNSVLADICLQGSTNRQICMFGFMQLIFTMMTLVFFVPTYYSWHAALLLQVFKFFLPMYYGARHFCNRLIQAAISEGIRVRRVEARQRRKMGLEHHEGFSESLFSGGGSETTDEDIQSELLDLSPILECSGWRGEEALVQTVLEQYNKTGSPETVSSYVFCFSIPENETDMNDALNWEVREVVMHPYYGIGSTDGERYENRTDDEMNNPVYGHAVLVNDIMQAGIDNKNEGYYVYGYI